MGLTKAWLAAAVGAGLVLLPAAPAHAQPPANDDFDAAVAVTVPFEVTADTTEATFAGDDPFACEGESHSVWYSLTLPATSEIAVHTFGSDYDTVLSAWTGERGSLAEVACNDQAAETNQSLIRFTAEAGVTYHLMVASWLDTGGGNLVLTGQVAPPAMELAVTLDPAGTVAGGAAEIGGTVSCSRPAVLELVGTLTQRSAGRVTVGSYRVPVDCTGSHSWQATVLGETGVYRRGPASGVAVASFDDQIRGELVRVRVTATVQLG